MDISAPLHYPLRLPKSLLLFIAATALGLLVFVPLAFVGISLEKIALLLVGAAGIAASFLPAAFLALFFAAGLYLGKYRDLHPAPWREQLW